MPKKAIYITLVLAILIRLFLMFFCYHPDLAGQSLSSYFWGTENVTNVYDHLLQLPPSHPLVRNFGVNDIFIYPPLTYFALGTFQKIFAFTDLSHFLQTLMSGSNVLKITGLNFYLFILKLPYLFVDLAVAWLLYRYFSTPRAKQIALLLWLFNPVTLYATFAMGVFDIIPVFFTVLALSFYKNQKVSLSLLSLGLGSAFKMFPIFLVPFVVLSSTQKFTQRIKYLLISLVPLLITNLPYITSSAYRYMVFSPKSQKMLYMEWMLTGAEGIFPFLLVLVFLYLMSQRIKLKPQLFSTYFFVFFLLLFSVTHYHPQWFLWLTPFLIIELINYNFKETYLYLGLLSIYIFIVFTFENSLSVGLFAPLYPALAQFTGTSIILSHLTNIDMLKSEMRSVFAGISLYFAVTHLSKHAQT